MRKRKKALNYISKKFSKSATIGALLIVGQIFSPANLPFTSPALAKRNTQQLVLDQENEKPGITDETINGKTYCVTRTLVKAKPDQVWQILTDYRHAVNIFPLLKKCEVLENHGSTKIAKHEIAPSGIPDTFEYILEVHETAPKLMEWRRISGDFKEVEGSWKLEPANNGKYTEVTYSSHVTGGFLMPQMIIKHQAHIDMPDTLLALKKHAESTTQIASRAEQIKIQ
jgi:ribosome-associated toxin RatA of RatAB toxin-antitoxin module